MRKIGPFLLIRSIGRGGFAPVWVAREMYGETELRTVAIKLFSLAGGGSTGHPPSATRLIIDEARALCQVEHPNVVRFYSIAVDETRRLMGLAMEYLAGTPLDRKLKELGKFAFLEAIDVGLAVASALAAVHRTGIVHRDVKPANIVQTDSGYKLIDFGIALGTHATNPDGALFEVEDMPIDRLADGHSVCVSTGQTDRRNIAGLVGTLGFIDPECLARGVAANGSSDLYSLGATLFQLITGELPAASGGILRGDVLGGRRRAPALSQVVPQVPTHFAELIDRLLSPTREGRPRSADWVATRLQEIRNELAGRRTSLPREEIGPFRGLARFEMNDQGVYFGRTLEIAQALHVLRVRGLVALLGPSGSGKSSLARAGVAPAVAVGELGVWPEKWDSITVVPGADPRAELLAALAPIVGEFPSELESTLAPSELLADLGDSVQRSGRGVVLLIDQLEELATLSRADSRSWVVELLAIVSDQPLPGVRVVVTARRDLLAPLLEIAGLGKAVLHNAILVEPMTPSAWSEVLDHALGAYGYSWEDQSLGGRVASEIDRTASAMPLVQFALARLWERRDTERRLLTWRAYQEMGGIAGALAQHAESTLAAVARELPDGVVAARRTLLALSTPQGTRAVRELSVIERAAGNAARRVLQVFEEARLVVRLTTGHTLAHEALLTEWRRLNGWLADARDARVLIEQLEIDAERWGADRDAASLWRRRRLALAAEALDREGLSLTDVGRAFFQAGLWSERRRRMTLAMALATVVAIGVGGSVSYVHAVKTERTRTQAALEGERASRLLAESSTHEVQAAQQRIDELLRGIADSSAKAEVLELQAKIRAVAQPLKPDLPRPRAGASATPSPAPTPSGVASSPPRIRVQDEW